MSSIIFSKLHNWARSMVRIPVADEANGYEFDSRTGRLRAAEREVVLRPKTAALLEVLTSEPETIHSKQQILDRLWSNIHVQDQAVFQCINEIRQAFASKNCIRTIPGQGYQWVGLLNKAAPRHRKVWPRAAFVICTAVLLFGLPFLASDTTHSSMTQVAVFPIVSSSEAPRDNGLSLGFMAMINNQSGQMNNVEIAPAGTVLGIAGTQLIAGENANSDGSDSDLLVYVSISRSGELLLATFKIKGGVGQVEGSYESGSQAWLAQQIAYEIDDAIRYSLIPEDSTPDRVARHQLLIAARENFFANELEAAAALAKSAATDPAYLSARYLSLLTKNSLGLPINDSDITQLATRSRLAGDGANEARAFLLSARKSQREGSYSIAREYINDGRAVAKRHGLDSLIAAFDFNSGISYSAEGSFEQAAQAYKTAISGYKMTNCALSLVDTYRHLAQVYRSVGAVEEELEVIAKINAIETLYPYTITRT